MQPLSIQNEMWYKVTYNNIKSIMMAPQYHIYDGVTPAHIKKFYENMAKERLNIKHPNVVIKIKDDTT